MRARPWRPAKKRRRPSGPVSSWPRDRWRLRWARQQAAESIFKQLLLDHPLSAEAQTARARLTQMGAESSLTTAELRSLGDAYYNAGRYSEAGEQYRALAAHAGA